MRWEDVVAGYDWVARVHFAGTLMSLAGSIAVGVAAYFEGWDWLAIILAMLFAFATIAVVYLGFCKFWDRRTQEIKTAVPDQILLVSPKPQIETIPDTDPRELFFSILEKSAWKDDQKPNVEPQHLARDWLAIRLSEQIHEALLNEKLRARGKECLPGTVTTPEKPIPPTVWNTVEIRFDKTLANCAAFEKGRTSREPGRMAWVGVKVSREQFFQLFPLDSSPTIDRIPCTELLRMAEAEGWDFRSNDSLHLLDMQDAMRQGGIDETLRMWGRPKKWDDDRLMRNEVLLKIPASHWTDYVVHLFAAREGDNFNTYSWLTTGKVGQRGFVDLHVERTNAVKWLRHDAALFRGKTKPR